MLLPKQIDRPLSYGYDGSVGISADDDRHDRRVGHPKALDAEDTELRVDHPTDPARARRVIESLCMAFDERPDIRVTAGCRHEMRSPAHRDKSGPLRNVHCELDAANHAPTIFFGRQVVAENPWLDIRPCAAELDASATGRFQDDGPEDVGVIEGLRQTLLIEHDGSSIKHDVR